jgi:hypothetical protein
VQVDPFKPTLKPPATKRLKLKYEEPLSSYGFKFDLRRYIEALPSAVSGDVPELLGAGRQGLTLVHFSAQLERFVWDRGCA